MALGRRESERQSEFWVAAVDVPRTAGHPFYEKLNELLAEAGFDRFVEGLCEPHYAKCGRPGIPPGVYFRMLFVGYFEGLDSQRGIAWRCADSLALKSFLGYGLTDATPEHSSLTVIRQRLPEVIHEQVFARVLGLAREKQLLKGRQVGIDATLLEANAAMKSIVRKDSGDDWKAWLRKLAQEAGIEDPSDDDLKKFDQGRKSKKVSNREWESSTDRDARIMKMKDGRTHLAYKAEHAVDLESGLLLAATIHAGDAADGETLQDTLVAAQAQMLMGCGAAETRPVNDTRTADATNPADDTSPEIRAVAADRGYHRNETLAQCEAWGVRTYIAEKQEKHRRVWTNKPASQQHAFRGNRRRVRGRRGRVLQRLRSEFCERSFAHSCETGGGRRTWLRGFEKVRKRYTIQAAAFNLGVLMRALFGMGKPRTLQGGLAGLCAALLAAMTCVITCIRERHETRFNRSRDGNERKLLGIA